MRCGCSYAVGSCDQASRRHERMVTRVTCLISNVQRTEGTQTSCCSGNQAWRVWQGWWNGADWRTCLCLHLPVHTCAHLPFPGFSCAHLALTSCRWASPTHPCTYVSHLCHEGMGQVLPPGRLKSRSPKCWPPRSQTQAPLLGIDRRELSLSVKSIWVHLSHKIFMTFSAGQRSWLRSSLLMVRCPSFYFSVK